MKSPHNQHWLVLSVLGLAGYGATVETTALVISELKFAGKLDDVKWKKYY